MGGRIGGRGRLEGARRVINPKVFACLPLRINDLCVDGLEVGRRWDTLPYRTPLQPG